MIRQLNSILMTVAIFSTSTSDGYNYRPYISTNLAKATMIEPAEIIEDQCDGSGWITHGDGHKTECPGCSKCINLTVDVSTPDSVECLDEVKPKPQRKGLLKRIFRR